MRDTLPAVSSPLHSTRIPGSWQARLAVPLGLLLLTVVYFWPQIVEGRVLYWGDIGLYFAPMQEFLRENLRDGKLPLWNPMIFCGTPYVGNPQTWPLYPVTALLPFVSASYFLNSTIALHVWLAGMGTYLFARRALWLGRGAALLAAVTFMFGGQLVSKEQFPNMVQAAAWLPWVLVCLDRLLHRRRMVDALWLGSVMGLQLLAAHPQMTLMTLYLAAAWGGRKLAVRPQFWGAGTGKTKRDWHFFLLLAPQNWGGGACLLLLSGLIALALAAGQILPTLGLFQDAARQTLTFHMVNRFFLPTNELGNFVLPRIHGHPYFGDWTARGNFWETCCYVGWLPCFFSLWGIISAWRKRGMSSARFWTAVFILGVWMALGGAGGLYQYAFLHLPGFRSFHDPARCLLWACFALSLLAGYGWEKSARNLTLPALGGRGTSACLLLLTFADLTYFGRTLYPLANPAVLHPISPNIAAVQADRDIQMHQARILDSSPGIWLRFTNYKDFRQNLPDYQEKWADTMAANRMMSYGLMDAYGYEPVPLRNAQKRDGGSEYSFEPRASPGEWAQAATRAGNLSVKFVVVCRVEPPERSVNGLLPVRTAPTLAPPGRKHSAPAFIYLSQNEKWQPRARMENSPSSPVALRDEGPDQVTLTPVTTGAGTLILADTQAAGWQATVDGVPTQIRPINGSLRTVWLPGAGTHTVVFSYRPRRFQVGLYFSLLTVLGLLACAAQAAGRKIFAREGFTRQNVE